MFSQNCVTSINKVTNPTFEFISGFTGPGLLDIFYQGKVKDWQNSHGNAHHIAYHVTGLPLCYATWNNISDVNRVCIGGAKQSNPPFEFAEGVFTNLNFVQSPYYNYTVSMTATRLDCNDSPGQQVPGRLSIKMANNLVNSAGSIPSVPNFLIGTQDINVFDLPIPISINVQSIPQNFSQLWLHSEPPSQDGFVQIGMSNISVVCHTTALTGINVFGCGNQLSFEPAILENNWKSFCWDFGDGTYSNLTSPTHTFSGNGTYNVCVNAIDNNDCTAQFCQQIVVEQCTCPTPPNFLVINCYNGHKISQLFPNQTVFDNVNWVINGKLELDKGITLRNSHLKMGPGSEVLINTTEKIVMQTNEFSGCSKMWKGISLGSPNNVGIVELKQGNTIMDAVYGLQILGDSKISITQNNFINCHIGIYSPTTSIQKQFLGGSIRENIFEVRGSFLPLYNNQATNTGSNWGGIHVNDITSLTISANYTEINGISYPNTFRGLQSGIYASNTSINILNNVFENITTNGANTNENFNGKCILLSNSPFSNIKGNNLSTSTSNIHLVNCNISKHKIISNTISLSSYYGIFFSNLNNSKVSITGNSFDFTNSATNNLGTGVYGTNCNLLDVNLSSGNTYYMKKGLQLAYFSNISSGTLSTISGNSTVNGQPANGNGRGITLYGCSGFKIEDNIIKRLFSGVFISGGRNNSVKSNYIDLENVGGNTSVGINIQNSKVDACCNEIKKAYYGTQFVGSCLGSQINNSIFENCNRGLKLNYGIIGPQPMAGVTTLSGNRWFDTNNTPTTAEIFPTNQAIGLASSSPIFFNNINPNQANTKPIQFIPSSIGADGVWFKTSQNLANFCSQNPSCGFTQLNNNNGGNNNNGVTGIWPDPTVTPPSDPNYCRHDIILYYISIANGFVINSSYNYYNESNWDAQWYLYYLLQNTNQIYWANCSELWTFYVNFQQTIGQYQTTEIQLDVAYSMNSQTSTQVTSVMQQLEQANQNLLTLYENLIYGGSLESAMSAISIHNGLVSTSEILLSQISSSIDLQKISIGQNVTNSYQSLPLTYNFLSFQKNLYGYKAKALLSGFESFTVNDWNNIRTIANSCPLEYGKAVDEARSMLGLINETDFPNVDSLCIPPIPREKNPIELKRVQIVCSPNPSQGLFNLELPLKSENYDLKIFNYLGQQVFLAKTNGANQFTINLLEYTKGI